MPRRSGVFVVLGGLVGNCGGKTALRVARPVVGVELRGDRRAAVREQVAVDAFRRSRVAVADRRREFEIVQAGLDQVAGSRVPTFVRCNRVQRVGPGLDPDRLRSFRSLVRRLFPPQAWSARLRTVDGTNGSTAVRPKTRSLPPRPVARLWATRNSESAAVIGTTRRPASVLTSTSPSLSSQVRRTRINAGRDRGDPPLTSR